MKKLAAVLAAVCIVMAGCGAVQANAEQEEKKARFDLVDMQWVGTDTYTEIIVDNETGVMYLAFDNNRGGGITVMVDADGKPLIWKGAEQ